ncbi:ethanolamine utilization protein EutN [candidate division KSB3 bacterium]|uniref:Ethanolamine utilization protein EutN n=1 Tax=candidate division KSB3 bacterium TaxID=2044937 RepID=A0A2G6E487_9BACT|nr:MAG: ethanolamine utilization protein EutN [candidate division KSB3 bacterium]PIE29037.1 MAG: ethanolamine utilization protein EutN [candidate division KSB3 bacterium]
MILGKVVGTVVSSQRADGLDTPVYLLIETCDQQGQGQQQFLVALDLMGAAPGEIVLLSQGSAARQTAVTDGKPLDAVTIAIVDQLDQGGTLTYHRA